MVNNIIKILLLVVILVLVYLVYDSVMRPVRFNKEVTKRSDAVIQNLKDIRSAQMAYKNINNNYTGSFDTLLDFLRNGEIPVVKMVPDPEDTTFSKTITDTLGYIPVIDSLFGNRHDFDVNHLKLIPFTDNEEFGMEAGIIEKGGVEVNVFEVKVHYKVFLAGMNQQMVVNLIAAREQIEKYPGLKVGSMEEASTDGNWE
jgi:hypothetical protein